jgi:hypothetical protein
VIGLPPGFAYRIVTAEPYEDDTDDVSQFPPCVLADWIVKESPPLR